MEIKEKFTYSVTEELVVDVLCNKCGLSCNNKKRQYEARGEEWKPSPPHVREPLLSGLIEVEVSGEPECNIAFADGDYFQFSLCHLCIKELMKTFVIPPKAWRHCGEDGNPFDDLMKEQ